MSHFRPSPIWTAAILVATATASVRATDRVGACRSPDGACVEIDLDTCTATGGTYQGDGTTCAQAGGCDLPEECRVCCLPSGNCLLTDDVKVCDALCGVFQPNEVFCAFACDSCRLPDGSCDFREEQSCLDAGGVSRESIPDPPQGMTIWGACCFQDDCCRRLTEPDCANEGGTFLGLGTGCDCPGDVDGDGAVGFSDVVGILTSWGPCEACPEDVTCDGLVGFADVLEVLAGWGPCSCPP